MKMTIVLDSDDREGINDALKMVRIIIKSIRVTSLYTKKSLARLSLSNCFASTCVSPSNT